MSRQLGWLFCHFGIAVCFLKIFFLFIQSPSLSFILLWGTSQSCLCSKKDFCYSFLQVVQCISKSQLCVASSPMSHYFYWKLLLSESVTTSKVRRTLNKQWKALEFLIFPAPYVFLETFMLLPYLMLCLEPYSYMHIHSYSGSAKTKWKNFSMTIRLAMGKHSMWKSLQEELVPHK